MENKEQKLLSALKAISSLWPKETTAKIESVNGINDGRSRAILLAGAIEIAREAIKDYETPTGSHNGVYTRPECIFMYCPNPDKCKKDNKCDSPFRVKQADE